MSIQEYLFRKWQAEGLTARENEALTYLAELDPIRQGELETEWFNEQKRKRQDSSKASISHKIGSLRQ